MDATKLQALDGSESIPEMLKTIVIPQNLKLLSSSLPKANYEPLRLSNIDKASFMEQYHNKQPKPRHAQSLALLKPSGMNRRRPDLKYSDRVDDNLLNIDQAYGRSTPLKPRVQEYSANLPEEESHPRASNLPHIGRKPSASTLELKLKYLSRKRIEQLYEKESAKLELNNAAEENHSKKQLIENTRHFDHDNHR